jgi:hypothetical protein
LRQGGALTAAVAILAAGACALAVPSARAATCPVAPDPGALPDAAALKEMNAFEASLGVRPTGSTAHARFVDWIRDQLRTIPGVQLSETSYTINRWTSSSAALRITTGGVTTTLPIADAIPYTKPTGPDGVTAPLAIVPPEESITADNAAGKIVVREAPAGSVPNGAFLLPAVVWEPPYDPGNTIDPTANFYGDFINYGPRIYDLRNAAAAGAKGVLFVKELPRRQIVDHYEPYEGEEFQVPGLFLGSDEGKLITDAIEAGEHPTAQLMNRADVRPVETPTIEATIPGQSAQRIVIDSHTDGVNAAEDNGPVAMIALARYLAALPAECRPRTIEFTFATAHFYQRLRDPAIRNGGAWQTAEQLDRDYDAGTVSSVLVLEHLGAIDYEQFPRNDGGPGVELRPTGLRAIQFVAISPSPSLVGAVDQVVRSYDLQRSILLQGSDLPGATIPMHCSFGGEGTPFNHHLLPTIGVISAPQSLYDPPFGLEGIDFDVMRSELLAYTELVNRLGTMSQAEVDGSVPAERAQRAGGAPVCPQEITPPPEGASPPPLTGSSDEGSSGGCTDLRKFTFRIHQPRRGRVTTVLVYVNGKLAKRVHRHRVTRVSLKPRRRGTFAVKIVAITNTGSRTVSVRRYRGCKKGRPHTHVQHR